MADQAAPHPDVTDLYAVHGVFRDTLESAFCERGARNQAFGHSGCLYRAATSAA